LCVCVIDDESSIRESLSSLLRSAGLKVQAFSSALEFLASATPDALSCPVLDVQLPGVSGLDLQRELASGDAQIPIIFITGHGDIPMSVRAIKAGALKFLTKPFDDEYLLEAIRSASARNNKNERSPGRIAKECFEEGIGTDRALRAGRINPRL
jgi:FixJ family two-component response regulator